MNATMYSTCDLIVPLSVQYEKERGSVGHSGAVAETRDHHAESDIHAADAVGEMTDDEENVTVEITEDESLVRAGNPGVCPKNNSA